MAARGPDGTWSKDQIVAHVDAVRRMPEKRDDLVALLDEASPIYAGRGTNEVERLRGYLLASFASTGLPDAAVPYVLEELESGLNPYTVAAAARAVRGAESGAPNIVPLLLAAIERVKSADDIVSFHTFSPEPNASGSTTALAEIIRTLAWLGPLARSAGDDLRAMLQHPPGAFSRAIRNEIGHAIEAITQPAPNETGTCCSSAPSGDETIAHASSGSFEPSLRELELQDQDGRCLTLTEAFLGKPSAVAFFYTRCMNPQKCSLTITKLARLQRRLCDDALHGKVNVAGITYDPAFDLPARLRTYGADRGMVFDPCNRLLRTTGPFEPLRRWFDLGVSYGPVTVNRHRLDFVVLDETGRTAVAFKRRLWQEDDVVDALTQIEGRQDREAARA